MALWIVFVIFDYDLDFMIFDFMFLVLNYYIRDIFFTFEKL